MLPVQYTYDLTNIKNIASDFNLNYIFDNYTTFHYEKPTFSYRIGRTAGKFVSILKRDEVKEGFLVGYWITEAALYIMLLLLIPFSFISVITLIILAYGTYALFDIISR